MVSLSYIVRYIITNTLHQTQNLLETYQKSVINLLYSEFNFNFYEFELHLYSLVKSMCLLHYSYENNNLSDLLKDVVIVDNINIDIESINRKDELLRLLQDFQPIQFQWLSIKKVILSFMSLDDFASLIKPIECFRLFRSHFDPDSYKRIWKDNRIDTLHLYDVKHLSDEKEIMQYYYDLYPHGTTSCLIKKLIRGCCETAS